MKRIPRWVVVLLSVALGLPVRGSEAPSVRTPDLSGLEPAVAEQIGQIRRALTDQLAKTGAEPREVAAAYGDLGQVYFAYGWNDAAADSFRLATKSDDKQVAWAYLLGAAEQAAGRLDPAAEAFRRALDLSPAAGVAAIHLAEIRLLEGRPIEAETGLKTALAVPALAPAAHSLLGQAALARRDWPAAIEHLEAALAAVPDANRLHHPLALAYRGKGDLAKAEEHLAQAGQVGLKPPDPLLDAIAGLRTGERLAMMSGRTAARAGRFADAAKEFERALAARPESVEARVNLGSMLANLGDRAGAVEQFREALKRDPGNTTAHFNLASLLAQTSPERQEALTHIEAYVAARPEDGEAHRLRAQLLRDAGRLDEALLEYARAIELAPGDETARLGEAETLVRLALYADARKKLDEGLNQIPGSGLLSHALARLLAACPDTSVRDGKRSLELAVAVWNARQASAHAETLAMALAETGQCDEAAKWQQKAIDEAKSEGLEGRIEGLTRSMAVYAKGAPCRTAGNLAAQPETSECRAMVKQIRNDHVKWNGNYLGLTVEPLTEPEERVLQAGSSCRPFLIEALRDESRYVAAHVLLTLMAHTTYSVSGAEWNHLRIDLFADGRVEIPAGQRPKIEDLWKKK